MLKAQQPREVLTDYMKQEKDKELYDVLSQELSEKEETQKVIEKELKKVQKTADDNWGEILTLKQKMRHLKRKMGERSRTSTMYMVDFKEELSLYDPKVIFENNHILYFVFKASKMKIKKDMTWDQIFKVLEPIEVYVLLKTIVLKQFYKNIAYTIGGRIDEKEIKDIEQRAVDKMRKMSFIEKIYL